MSGLKRAQSISLRSTRGSLVALLPAAILIAIVGIGAFAMDISHNVTVRTELQSATDAAALSGARDLLDPKTMNSYDNDALTIAAANKADGVSVSPSTPGVTVTTQSTWDNATNSGTVTVDGSKQINNIFSKLFGHGSDTVSAHSVAQAWRSVTTIYPNQAFPLMVSLDTTNGNNQPLYKVPVGGSFVLWINSQQYKNAAWTGLTTNNTNANFITNSIDQLFGFQPMQAGYIPGVNVGDTLQLGNGVSAQKQLAKGSYIGVLTDPQTTLVLPVMQGDPPYNQNKQGVGFVTVKVTNVQIDQSGGQVMALNVTVVKGIVKGTGGIPGSTVGGVQLQNGMTTISAGTVKLVS